MATQFVIHPYAAEWPALDGDELSKMSQSIKSRGQRNPILVRKSDKLLIDGRNRFAACEAAGVEPVVSFIDATEDETIDMIADLNGCRRHLTESQRALLAARYVEAKRKLANANALLFSRRENESRSVVGDATKEAAKKFDVKESEVHKARSVDKRSPELAQDIKDGKESVHSATEKLAAKSKRKPQHKIVNPDVDSDLEHPDDAKREPGEDDVTILPPEPMTTKATAAIDKKLWTLHGQLVRGCDDRARVIGSQGKMHAASLEYLAGFQAALKAWIASGKP